MTGGVRKRGKTWSYYFYLGEFNGKKKYKEKGGFKRKGDAENALNEAIHDFENGGYVEPKAKNFIQFANEWLENYIKPIRKITTYNRYKELIRKYLSDGIGSMNISDIKSYHIEQLLLKNRRSLSGATLQSIYTLINTIMNRALKLKIIKDNPCKYVERPKRTKFIPNTLTVNEIKKVFIALDLKNTYDYMFYIALHLTLELGLRRGEVGGLEWDNIDFKNNLISIKNNLIYSNGHVYMITPKTEESNRIIYISNEILDLLKKLHKEQSKNRLKYGEFYIKNIFKNEKGEDKQYDLIMTWQNGKYIHPMYYLDKLKKVLKKAGITKNIRFHDLRHTNATLLLQQGISMKVVQERLGHKDISTTANIYSHVTKKLQEKATNSILKLLSPKTGKRLAK